MIILERTKQAVIYITVTGSWTLSDFFMQAAIVPVASGFLYIFDVECALLQDDHERHVRYCDFIMSASRSLA